MPTSHGTGEHQARERQARDTKARALARPIITLVARHYEVDPLHVEFRHVHHPHGGPPRPWSWAMMDRTPALRERLARWTVMYVLWMADYPMACIARVLSTDHATVKNALERLHEHPDAEDYAQRLTDLFARTGVAA